MSERDQKIKELETENQQLRTALASLGAALLREVAFDAVARQRLERANAERLMREAEGCFRCARLPELKPVIAEALEVAGHDLMARAVEIDAALQRDKGKK